MNYKNKKVLITGLNGFIGNAIAAKLDELQANVYYTIGDIREGKTFNRGHKGNDVSVLVDHSFDYIFHFAAPSSQVLFARNPKHCIEVTMKGFLNAMSVANRVGARLVYPSTGLLSQGRYNEYAMCKKLCEDAAKNTDALGIRIFATYGPGEGHKADYASVPYLFARDMLAGKAPIIFGTGEQVRDFIYIDDTVNAIARVAEECWDKTIDVGSGHQVSFNHIVKELKVLTGFKEDPNYLPPPNNYVEKTAADIATLYDYYQPKTTFAEGLARMVDSIRGTHVA